MADDFIFTDDFFDDDFTFDDFFSIDFPLDDNANNKCLTDDKNTNDTNKKSETNVANTVLDDHEIDDFIKGNRNHNTTKKTNADLNVFYRFAKTVNESRKLDEIPPTELNVILSHFVLKARKLNGDDFEPDSLTSFFRSFDRFLHEQGRDYSILNDGTFDKARETLASKRKELRRSGKGQKPQKAEGLTPRQIEELWSKRQLGDHSPQSLIKTIWFNNNTVYFGWRARDEHRRARLGDFIIKREEGPDGIEYIEWVIERGSKTRTGEQESVPLRAFNPKMFATQGPRCPVKMFKAYLSRRPLEMRNPDDPLYLATIQNPVSQVWFKKQPLGKASLGSFMKNMAKAAGLDGHHTNHSARRTMITTLRHKNVEPLNIIALAGQRNIKSLDSYSEASNEQKKQMSLMLSEEMQPNSPKLGPSSNISATNANSSVQKKPCKVIDGMLSGATFQNCSFSFGGFKGKENWPQAMPKPRSYKRILYSDSSDDEL